MLVSISVAAACFGVSTATLRRWEKQGKLIPHLRTLGGHRRYDSSQLLPENGSSKHQPKRTILYGRVSGSDQRDDLLRQGETLKLFASEQGWDSELITDLGSGLAYEKRGLKKLIRLILESRVERLVLTHKDRLLRFGSALVFQLCAHFGTEVIVLDKVEKTPSFEEELAADVLEVLTVFSAKLYGRRSHQNRKKAA